jgi:hypothetical protein
MKTVQWLGILFCLTLSACGTADYDAVPSRGISQDITAAQFQSGRSSVSRTLEFRDTDITR